MAINGHLMAIKWLLMAINGHEWPFDGHFNSGAPELWRGLEYSRVSFEGATAHCAERYVRLGSSTKELSLGIFVSELSFGSFSRLSI